MENVFHHRRGGTNVFMPDGKDRRIPGKIGLQAIGGVMEHLPALTALGSSTVNSYRRLWDTGFWAPVYACLLYTSPSPRDATLSRMPSSA